MMYRTLVIAAGLLVAIALSASPAPAQDLIYRPQNPAFGGNPANFSWMMQSAEMQNRFREDHAQSLDDMMDDFQRNMQRQVLNALTSEFIQDQFGERDLSEGGSFNFGDFTVDITPGIDGIRLRVFNVLTGNETTVTIPHF